MVRGFGVQLTVVNKQQVENMLTGYKTSLPKATTKDARNIASMYAEMYLRQMDRAPGIGGGRSRISRWTGRSFNVLKSQIDNPIRSGDGYIVVAPGSLVMLDQMRIHKVSLRRGSSISRWAKTKGFIPRHGNSITVHPHPWINNANRNAARRIPNTIKEFQKAVRRKGR